MVILREIKKENNIISVIYIPDEDQEDIGAITFDILRDEVIECKYCKTDEQSYLHTYYHKAIAAIRKMIENGEYPEEYEYCWY